MVAYEPLWAIDSTKLGGKNFPAIPGFVQEAHALIRQWLIDTYSNKVGKATRIIYAGPINNESHAEQLIEQ